MNSVKPIFEKTLRKNLIYLESEGYQLHKIEILKASVLLGSALVATLKNSKVDRIVTFKYYQSGFLQASIEQINPPELEWSDYTSTNSMCVYNSDINLMVGTLEKCFYSCMKEVNETLKDKFHKVIIGQYFKSDQLGWGGQK